MIFYPITIVVLLGLHAWTYVRLTRALQGERDRFAAYRAIMAKEDKVATPAAADPAGFYGPYARANVVKTNAGWTVSNGTGGASPLKSGETVTIEWPPVSLP